MPTTINKIGVIGAGAWGTALAKHLAEKGGAVRLWAYEPTVVEAINTSHENSVYLKGVTLPPDLVATSSLVEAIHACHGLIFAVPSHAARSILRDLAPHLADSRPVVCASKGIEERKRK